MWKVSIVALTSVKTLFTGSPVKGIVDTNASTFQPALQGTEEMLAQATPPEELATLLESLNQQRVDVLALVMRVERERSATTADGQKKIVDVTIRDLSGVAGASECEFALFFNDSVAGRAELEALRRACSAGETVAFFHLVVTEAST